MKNTIHFALLIIVLFTILSCDDSITDFGHDGEISGRVLDQNGNIISGDITNVNLVVNLIAEGEDIPIEIRVKGDGTYLNSHLYPQVYTAWVEGPLASASSEFIVDLRNGSVNQDFTVTPLISLLTPEVSGSPSSNSVSVLYNINPNTEKDITDRILYVSTVSYPSQSVGSGPYWQTISVLLPDNSGVIDVDGLNSGTNYFIRTAARADNSNRWNYSDQIRIKTAQ